MIPSGCGQFAKGMPSEIRREIRGDLEFYEALMTFEPDTLSTLKAAPQRA
jgi:hypothetical protein